MVGVDTATQTSAGVAGSIIAQRPQVAINNVTLSNGLAQGGSGSGGGMGAGGALFVNQSADVTLSNVSFANNTARGAAGGPHLLRPNRRRRPRRELSTAHRRQCRRRWHFRQRDRRRRRL